jgi:hypothetical protein
MRCRDEAGQFPLLPAQTFHRFGNIRFAALSRNGQRRQTDRLRPFREVSEILTSGANLGNGTGVLTMASPRTMLSHMTTNNAQ